MTLQPNRNIIIIGAGPFLSRSLSIWLASQNWKIVLIARTSSTLEALAREINIIHPSSPPVLTHTADASSPTSLLSALNWAASQLGTVDVLCYNAAVVAPSPLLTTTASTLEFDFKVCAIGTLVAGQWFVTHASTSRTSADAALPLFLVPGGVLDRYPEAGYASLSAAKAASQNVAKNFVSLMKETRVLVGCPLVSGSIIPDGEGGWRTRYVPDVIVRDIFVPFFVDRERIEENLEGWVGERVF